MSRTYLLALVVLGFVAALSFLLEYLALVDIWHGYEPDLTLEWNVVTWTRWPIFAFFVAFFVGAAKQLRRSTG